MVSDRYINLMKLEENNRKHTYRIYNRSSDIEVTDLLDIQALKINRQLRIEGEGLTPNSVELRFVGKRGEKNDYLVKDFHRSYKEFKGVSWRDILNIETIDEYLFKHDDIVEITDTFNNETLTIFLGRVREIAITDNYFARNITITVHDGTIYGYDNKLTDDIILNDCYLYNDSDKENSILYILAKKMGFEDDKLFIENMQFADNEFIKFKFLRVEKGKKIMQSLANLVKSCYGNIFTLNNGSLKITSPFNRDDIQKLDITIGTNKGDFPVLNKMSRSFTKAQGNKVEVSYSDINTTEEQTIFMLIGANGDVSDARIVVKANSPKIADYWKIELDNVARVNNTPEVIAYKLRGEVREYITYTDFKLDIDTKGGKLWLTNPSEQDIYIEKFLIKGLPFYINEGNKVTYTENKNLDDNNTNLKSFNNEYVLDKRQAKELSKYIYYNECRDYFKISLTTNNLPFLELEQVINVNYLKYQGKYQIVGIVQNNDSTELTLIEYKEYIANDENMITEYASNANSKYLQSKGIHNTLNSLANVSGIVVGTYDYDHTQANPITITTIDTSKYNIIAVMTKMVIATDADPSLEDKMLMFICQPVITETGFYIKVGLGFRMHSNIIMRSGGSAMWIAIPKGRSN